MLQKTGKARSGSKTKTRVRVVEDGRARVKSDHLATEEPMEIRLVTGGKRQTVAVTMRTPGADFELAAGFLYGEGIVSSRDEEAITIRFGGLDREQTMTVPLKYVGGDEEAAELWLMAQLQEIGYRVRRGT